MWIYSQSTGELKHDADHIGWGYSGFGIAKNEPGLQHIPDRGPIPQGFYSIELIRGEQLEPVDYEGKESPVMRLIAEPETQTFGRNGFLIHGDSISAPGTASKGCIIMPHGVRQQVAASEDTDLQVTT